MKSYVGRKYEEIEGNEDLIEITPIMKSVIDEAIAYKSKIYCVNKYCYTRTGNRFAQNNIK